MDLIKAADLTAIGSLEALGTSLALAFLCWQAPSMAASLVTGRSTGSADSARAAASGMNTAGKEMGGMQGGGIGKMMESIKGAIGKSPLEKSANSLGNRDL